MPDREPSIADNQESKSENINRKYKEFLTKNNELENNPKVSVDKYTTQKGNEVTIYNLDGANFAFLSHTVGLGNRNSNLETSKSIVEEISHWDSKKKGEANNQISCSLITHDHIAHAGDVSETQVLLGFNQIEIGDIVLASRSDAGTVVDKSKVITEMDNWNDYSPETVIKTTNRGHDYNEIVISRYQGEKARKPDFIIIFNDQTNQRIEQAIDYFQVPIINIRTNSYIENINQKIEQVIVNTKNAKTFDEQKKIFSEISYLSADKTNWLAIKKALYNESIENNISQEILNLEELIIDKQLSQDKQNAKNASEKFIGQSDLTSIQEIRNLLFDLNLNTYSPYHGKSPIDFLSHDKNLFSKWQRGSHEILAQTLITTTPNIINIYQQQSILITSKVSEITSQEIDKKIQEFSKNITVSKIETTGEILLLNGNGDLTHEIISDPMYILSEQFPHPELLNPLLQIWSAQEEYGRTLMKCQTQIKQREKQQQIDQQMSLIDTNSNNIGNMIALLKEGPIVENFNFKEIILKKIEEYLMDPTKKLTEVLQNFRNYYVLRQEFFQKYFDNINDQYTKEIFWLLTNPNKVSQMPQKIQISEMITDQIKFTVFTNQNGQESVFKIDKDYGSSKLEKINNDSSEILDKINQRWFWRLRRGLPKIKQQETYQFTFSFGNNLLLTKSKKDWYLINESSIKKINLSDFNIEDKK